MKINLLITGGLGYIGSFTAKNILAKSKKKTYVIDDLSRGNDFAKKYSNYKLLNVSEKKTQKFIQDKKIMHMPRYMNHKDDILFKKDATAAIDAFNYGVLGEQAVVHNYVDVIEKDTINMLEVYAYNFDKLQPFLKGLPSDKKKRINYRDLIK